MANSLTLRKREQEESKDRQRGQMVCQGEGQETGSWNAERGARTERIRKWERIN